MPHLHVDAPFDEPARRAQMFDGALFLASATPAFQDLNEFARSRIAQAFAPLAPRTAQDALAVERFVEVVGPLKSDFTNHRRTKELVRAVLAERGYDLDATYFDVPRLRVVAAGSYLRAGVGYAYKAHRDTWYASPQSQINWWSPLYDLESSQSLVFYPGYFERAVPNSSNDFDYGDWQKNGRAAASMQVAADRRNHPLPLGELSDADELRIVMRADQSIMFSAAHLHATAPNTASTTRFSIDFRTVDIADLAAGRGAPNADARASGSTIGDYIRANDFAPLDLALVEA